MNRRTGKRALWITLTGAVLLAVALWAQVGENFGNTEPSMSPGIEPVGCVVLAPAGVHPIRFGLKEAGSLPGLSSYGQGRVVHHAD